MSPIIEIGENCKLIGELRAYLFILSQNVKKKKFTKEITLGLANIKTFVWLMGL